MAQRKNQPSTAIAVVEAQEVTPFELFGAPVTDAPKGLQNFSIMADEDLGDVIEAMADQLQSGIGEFDLLNITCPTGGLTTWSVPVLGQIQQRDALNCVILGQTAERTFYSKSFEESDGGRPDCQSYDMQHGFGTLPAEQLERQGWAATDGAQGGSGFDCETCEQAQWDSAAGGKRKGQACRSFINLFVMLDAEVLPAKVRVTPGSLKGFKSFQVDCTRAKAPMHMVSVEMTLKEVKGPPKYSQIVFKAATKDPEDSIVRRRESPKTAERIDYFRSLVQAHFLGHRGRNALTGPAVEEL